MKELRVGQPAPWPLPGGESFGWHPPAGNTIVLGAAEPSGPHRAFLEQDLDLRLFRYRDIVVLLARAASGQWVDAIWAATSNEDCTAVHGLLETGAHATMTLAVTDASRSHEVVGLRPIQTSRHFASSVGAHLSDLVADGPVSQSSILETSMAYQARYPDPRKAAADASARHRVRGG